MASRTSISRHYVGYNVNDVEVSLAPGLPTRPADEIGQIDLYGHLTTMRTRNPPG